MLVAASGHSVSSPLLASIGNDDKLVAFTANRFLMVGPMTSPLPHLVPPGINLTALALHPNKPHLLCGTRENGLFLLRVSDVSFSPEQHLPLPAGASNVVCCHFLVTASRTLFVCCLQGKPSRSTAIIGDAATKATLWMSHAADMEGLAPLLGSLSFASCNKREVAIWHCAFQSPPPVSKPLTARPSSQPPPPRKEALEVKQKICDTIAELKGAEFVAIAVPPTKDAQTVLALTTAGFLVCFGRADGGVQKWMDCKVCPATSVLVTLRHVVVCGAACRFFTASSWDFVGKVKVEAFSGNRSVAQSFLSDLFHSLCVTGTATESAATLFFGNGAMTTFSLEANAKGRLAMTPSAKHCTIDQSRECTWLPCAENGHLALWTATDLRLLSDATLREVGSVPAELTALTFHPTVRCYFGYDSRGSELVAYDELTLTAKARVHVDEPLVSLTHLQEGRLVGLAPNNSLHFFAASRGVDDDTAPMSLQFACQRQLPSNQIVSAVCFASATLCGIAASALHNIGAGSTFPLPSPIHCFAVTTDRVILSHGCVISIIEPSSFRVHQIEFGAPAIEVRVHPGLRYVAARTQSRNGESATSIIDAKRGSGAVVGKLVLRCNIKALAFAGDGSLVASDDKGVLSLWQIFDKSTKAILLPQPEVDAGGAPLRDGEAEPARRRACSAIREDQRKRFAELDALAQKTLRNRHADVNSSGLLFGGADDERGDGLTRPGAHPGYLDGRQKWETGQQAAVTTGGFAFPRVGSATGSVLRSDGSHVDGTTRTITVREVSSTGGVRPPLPMPPRPQLVSPLDDGEITAMKWPAAAASPPTRQAMTAVLALPDDDDNEFEDVSESVAALLLAKERDRVRESELEAVLVRGDSPRRKGDDAGCVEAVKEAASDEDDDIVLISSTDGHLQAIAAAQPYTAVVFAHHRAPAAASHDQPAAAAPVAEAVRPETSNGTRPNSANCASEWLAETRRRLAEDSVTDDEALEIATAVADVISAIQERALRRPESAASSGRSPTADRLWGSVATSTGTASQFNVVWAEMQRLREQNDRIESQNRSILQAISRLSADKGN